MSSIISILNFIVIFLYVTYLFDLYNCIVECSLLLSPYWLYLRLIYQVEYGFSGAVRVFNNLFHWILVALDFIPDGYIPSVDSLLNEDELRVYSFQRIYNVRVKSMKDKDTFCMFNLMTLFRIMGKRGVAPPVINTTFALLDWCRDNSIPVYLQSDAGWHVYSWGLFRDYAVRIEGSHVSLIRYEMIGSYFCPVNIEFTNSFLFGYRQMEQRIGKLEVSAFKGMKRNALKSLEFLGDDLALCLSYAGCVSMSELMSRAESIFDPLNDCLSNIIHQHSFKSKTGELSGVSLTGDLLGFLFRWRMPLSWGVGFLDGEKVVVMSDNRRVKNLVIVNGAHVMTVHIPITLYSNSYTYYCDTKFVGARNGKKWVAKAPAPAPIVYPGSAGIRQDIARNKDWLELQDLNRKIGQLNAPAKTPSTDPHELTGKITYAEVKFAERRDRIVLFIIMTFFIHISLTSQQALPFVVFCLIVRCIHNFKWVRQLIRYFGKYKRFFPIFINCHIWLRVPITVTHYLMDLNYKTDGFSTSRVDFLRLVLPTRKYGLLTLLPEWEIFWLSISFILLCWSLWLFRVQIYTKKLKIWSGASEVYINNEDMRVDVHKQGRFEHYQNVSTYCFDYCICDFCDDPMNCKHPFKEIEQGQFPVCNELLAQLLGPDKVRAGDDLSVIKERMVRCIANNSSINRDRFSNLSNIDLDRNTLRVALAIVASRKIRDRKKGADCLSLNY